MAHARSSTGLTVAALAALLPVLPGLSCGRPGPQRPVFPVRGQVLLDGKPVANALVVFHPAGADETRPRAETDSDGRFAVSTYGTGDGAPTGEYKVAVLDLHGEGEAGEAPADEGGARKGAPGRPPARYADPESSDLRARVLEGNNELEPFRLKPGPGGPAGATAPRVGD